MPQPFCIAESSGQKAKRRRVDEGPQAAPRPGDLVQAGADEGNALARLGSERAYARWLRCQACVMLLSVTRWNEILRHTSHRPYPLPAGRMFGTMSWHDLLFAHYRVDRDALRALVPPRLELDLWHGEAWIGVVPFYMTHVGLPGFNRLPWLSAFAELNVRTYVRHGGKSGVLFLSLDAANWAAVLAARAGFLLPYFWARMRCHRRGQEVLYRSQRLVGPAARFEARYAPTGEPQRSAPGSFEHWLTERYCLFTVGSQGDPYRCDIHHEPWPLQPAEASITTLDMTASQRLSLSGEPALHFARQLDVLAWPLRRAEAP